MGASLKYKLIFSFMNQRGIVFDNTDSEEHNKWLNWFLLNGVCVVKGLNLFEINMSEMYYFVLK